MAWSAACWASASLMQVSTSALGKTATFGVAIVVAITVPSEYQTYTYIMSDIQTRGQWVVGVRDCFPNGPVPGAIPHSIAFREVPHREMLSNKRRKWGHEARSGGRGRAKVRNTAHPQRCGLPQGLGGLSL